MTVHRECRIFFKRNSTLHCQSGSPETVLSKIKYSRMRVHYGSSMAAFVLLLFSFSTTDGVIDDYSQERFSENPGLFAQDPSNSRLHIDVLQRPPANEDLQRGNRLYLSEPGPIINNLVPPSDMFRLHSGNIFLQEMLRHRDEGGPLTENSYSADRTDDLSRLLESLERGSGKRTPSGSWQFLSRKRSGFGEKGFVEEEPDSEEAKSIHFTPKRWWGGGNVSRKGPTKIDRRGATSKLYVCLKRCIEHGRLHPIQCHSVC